MAWAEKGTAWGFSSLGLKSGPQSCSLKLKLLVLHWVTSQFSMVRSVKLTFPSLSMRITVLVLWRTYRQTDRQENIKTFTVVLIWRLLLLSSGVEGFWPCAVSWWAHTHRRQGLKHGHTVAHPLTLLCWVWGVSETRRSCVKSCCYFDAEKC